MTDLDTPRDDVEREWVAYRCPCGYCHEITQSNHANVEAGDYCLKCGRQFTEDDRYTRASGELFEWEKQPETDQ